MERRWFWGVLKKGACSVMVIVVGSRLGYPSSSSEWGYLYVKCMYVKCFSVKCMYEKCFSVKCMYVKCFSVKCMYVKCFSVKCMCVKCFSVKCMNAYKTWYSNWSRRNETEFKFVVFTGWAPLGYSDPKHATWVALLRTNQVMAQVTSDINWKVLIKKGKYFWYTLSLCLCNISYC